MAPLVPLNERIVGMPTGVVLWVKVAMDGRPLSFQIVRHSSDPQFDRLAAGFANAQGFLQRDLVERIDAHLDAVGVDAAAVLLDLDTH